MAISCATVTGGGNWDVFGTWITSTAGSGDCLDSNSGTWSAPSAANDVVIPSTTAVIGSANMAAKSVTINGDGKFTSGSNTLMISGNFTNNATTATNVNLAGSSVVFDASATVGGSAVTTFDNLTTSAPLTLPTGATSAIINATLTINTGGSIAAGTVKFSDLNHNIAANVGSTIPTLDLSAITGSKTIAFNGSANTIINALTLPSPNAPGGASKVVVFTILNTKTLTFSGGIPSACAVTPPYATAPGGVVMGVTGGNLTCTIPAQSAVPASVDLRETGKVTTTSEEISIK
jgi:hypothetical protein